MVAVKTSDVVSKVSGGVDADLTNCVFMCDRRFQLTRVVVEDRTKDGRSLRTNVLVRRTEVDHLMSQ
jgi:hypothetical protein